MAQIQLSDFVGDHGPYQLTISIVLFFRYLFLGLMANSGPLMTPDVTFYCSLPMEEIVAIMPNITKLNQTQQELELKEEFKRICQIDLHLYQQAYLNSSKQQELISERELAERESGGRQRGNSLMLSQNQHHKLINATDKIRECTDFSYEIAPDQGRTMTSEFDLVCERDWLRSLFQSLLSAAIVVAHVFWGTFSDKYGRFRAQKLCLIVSLLAGGCSIMASDFWLFVICRALCSFGDLGLAVSLTTTVVELVGNQYRGLSVAMVNFGYALGVTILPYIVAYCEDFRLVITITVLCHLISIPLIFTTNESVRWLLTNRKFHSAKKELRRIIRWNKRAYRCCSVWPLSLMIDVPRVGFNSATPATGNKGTSQKRRKKLLALEEKKAFESLFKQFIEQIESQNFCDPLGPSQVTSFESSSFTSAEPATSLSRNPLANGMGTVSDMLEVNRDLPEVEELKIQLAESGRPSISAIIPLCKPEKLGESLLRAEQESDRVEELKLAPENVRLFEIPEVIINQQESSPQSGAELGEISSDESVAPDWTHLQAPYSRADSCEHLERNIRPETKKRVLLNIPANNMLNVSQEFRDAHFFRRRGQQADCINLVASQLSFVGRVSRLFRDKQLMIVVFTIVWTTFNSELQYTSFIIINLEVGEDVYLNYILGGCMEALAAIMASLLLSYAPRRSSLITFWLLISLSCFGLSVAHIDSTWAVWLLALAKFSQSCLSSIASVAAYESFPTFLRQSGSGLVFTLGMLGSVFAPLIFAEFDDHAGMDRVLMTFSLSSLTAAILIYLYLKETKNCELN